ncbi:site-specific DNA-methyltransferase [Nitrosopumilus sp.]|uniref:site-specific DNA-methyltransferase n=1 Tax=Nitrosopumilus sp. TaxID=2024843 RepID=UPI002614F932|nr:site-specific DNA-methyltransferase [Nitrosopumilus sp.]
MKTNRILCGNALSHLDELPDDSVNLVYLDPPFFANRIFQKKNHEGNSPSFNDKWVGGISEYISLMHDVFEHSKRLLKDTGSIYVHCDWHASHYLKVELDKVFGYDNFRNEIVWKRHNSHNDTKQGARNMGRIHDVILFYSKGKSPTWNPIYQKYPEEYVKKAYKHLEEKTGRYYAHGDLGGPGGAAKGDPYYTFLGITRYWRYSEKKMNQLYKEGKIVQTKPGNMPMLKRYLDEMKGIQLQDIWDDIKPIQHTRKESTRYPTQKPIKLLERIISMSTNEKDIVLDAFCGSGTTLVAAHNLGRRWIGIDQNPEACDIAEKRIQERLESEPIPVKAVAKRN